jgi:methionyl-tRNA formyltransferase
VRVLFWGTPDFAAPALRALLGEGFDVVGVVTQPDRPAGRSRSTMVAPPVKQIALDEGIPVLQPEKPRGDEFMASVRALEPDISVVVAYGHILPRAIIALPRLGTVNIHASLLPKLRGAAPIQAAIRDGFHETGVTIMRMVPALDAGPIIHAVRVPILEDESYGELAERLAEEGAMALIEALMLTDLGETHDVEQNEAEATYAAKIERAMTWVDWTADARAISRRVRAYDPRPGARAMLGDVEVKLFGAHLAPRTEDQPAGTVISIDERGMTVACGDAAVRLTMAQPAGKRALSPVEWAHGRGVHVGDRFASGAPGA